MPGVATPLSCRNREESPLAGRPAPVRTFGGPKNDAPGWGKVRAATDSLDPPVMGQPGFGSTDYFALFFELFQRSSDAVYLARLEDGVVLDVNDSFLSLHGLTREQTIGRTPGELGILVRPKDGQALENELRACGRIDHRIVRSEASGARSSRSLFHSSSPGGAIPMSSWASAGSSPRARPS